jgi:hypothetical protein
MAKKLLTLIYERLPIAPHLLFFQETETRLDAAAEAIRLALAAVMPPFRSRVAEEYSVFRWVRKSELTKDIKATVKTIDSVLVSINAAVTVGLHSPGSAIKASAEKVYDLIKNYGDIAKESYDTKASDLLLLLDHFATDYAHDVDNIGMGIQVQLLQVAYTKFRNLLGQRETEQLQKPPYTAAEARLHTQAAWKSIETVLNANAAIGEDADVFGEFIDHLNFEIERYNIEYAHVRRDISGVGHTVSDNIPTQTFTEEPITVIPKIWYVDEDGKATRMWLGKDFDVSFRNNTDVGTAEVIIHGKGDYTGQVTLKFNIARKPTPNNN